MSLGIDANAYTTNDHTAYLFECTEGFYDGLGETTVGSSTGLFTELYPPIEKTPLKEVFGL